MLGIKMKIRKGRYYLSRGSELVKIVSEECTHLKTFLALSYPEDPVPANAYLVNHEGKYALAAFGEDTEMDLEKDITCSHCEGRGKIHRVTSPDEIEKHTCPACQSIGYFLTA